MSGVERSVISIHVGQSGTQMGQAIWELLTAEHEFSATGFALNPQKIKDDLTFQAFYRHTQADQYVPRAVFVDLEPTVIDELRTGAYKNLFHPDQLINGLEDASNIFSRGYYSSGKTVMAPYMNSLRKAAESTDALQGFIMSSAMGGGTGSGFGSLVLEHLSANYPKTAKISLQVAPSPTLATCMVEPYNCILNTHFQFDHTDVNFVVDNESMYQVCRDNLSIFAPTFLHVNRIIAQLWSALTVSFRFEGQNNVDLHALQTNLVPYPRIHFPVFSFAPILCKSRAHHQMLTIDEITRAVFDPSHQLISLQLDQGKCMAVSLLYRGAVNPSEVFKTIASVKSTYDIKFVDWCPTGFKVGINSMPPTVIDNSRLAPTPRNLTMITNNTAIGEAWKRINDKTAKLFAHRAFVHWFVGDGMEEGEITDATENICALVNDYNECGIDSEGGEPVESNPEEVEKEQASE